MPKSFALLFRYRWCTTLSAWFVWIENVFFLRRGVRTSSPTNVSCGSIAAAARSSLERQEGVHGINSAAREQRARGEPRLLWMCLAFYCVLQTTSSHEAMIQISDQDDD